MKDIEQRLEQLSGDIDQCLKALDSADDDDRDRLLEQLQTQVAERKATLAEALATERGQDPQWLQFQLKLTLALSARANEQLAAQRVRLGGYRKGRKQVQTYQQIESGRG
ncbi:hypothetical protein [Ferrimonas balearica]|uniref:hypothetical protein n=1 Tax=Ferrimonas balearica TaxID=44012 RepID=UPI001C99A062|nr:hypothetical protein [Ferrimonas balearica]MBY5990726.1 hypothetical protein [Ferrimonas balearica]